LKGKFIVVDLSAVVYQVNIGIHISIVVGLVVRVSITAL
jgi:hypothetical protein